MDASRVPVARLSSVQVPDLNTPIAVAHRKQHPKLPILLATGYAELQGAQPFELPRIAKPYTQQQLSAEITRLVSQRSQ